MAVLDPVLQTTAGVNLVGERVAAAAGGDEFENPVGQRRILYVWNEDDAPITVTIESTVTLHGVDYEDLEVEIPAESGPVPIGPFAPAVYNDDDGLVQVAYSAVDDGEDPPVQTAFVALVKVP